MARGLSPRTLRDFTYFCRNRVCEASKVCLLKLLRYSPFNPRRDHPNTWFNKNSYRRHAYNGSTPIYFYIRFWNPQRDSAGLWRRWKRLCGVERLNRDGEAQSASDICKLQPPFWIHFTQYEKWHKSKVLLQFNEVVCCRRRVGGGGAEHSDRRKGWSCPNEPTSPTSDILIMFPRDCSVAIKKLLVELRMFKD